MTSKETNHKKAAAYYYDCRLQALYMAEYFNLKYMVLIPAIDSLKQDNVFMWMEHEIDKEMLDEFLPNKWQKHKYFLSPLSLEALKLQKGDVIKQTIENVEDFLKLDLMGEGAEKHINFDSAQVIIRDKKLFFWPKSLYSF